MRIFSHAPDAPRLVPTVPALATDPSRPCALTECTRSLSLASSGGQEPYGSASSRGDLRSFSSRRFVSGSPMTSRRQDQHIEHEQMQVRAGRMVLQEVERRFAAWVEGDDFAVNDRFVGTTGGRCNGGIAEEKSLSLRDRS